MSENIANKVKKIEDGCIEYANTATGKLYSGFTPPSKTGSTNGSIIAVCLKHGGIESYKASVSPENEKECNTYADDAAGRHYSAMGNPANFGSTKGAILTACLNAGGIIPYQDSIMHGLPQAANNNPQTRRP